MQSFWQVLPKPFFVLAPMEEVTDTVFRQIISSCGQPDVMVSEFTSVEGLASEIGRSKVIHRLQYTPSEHPLVAQIWGITPEHYYQAGLYAKEQGFAGLDINMGCPVKKVIKQGACSALIKNPTLASDIIQAAKEGAGDIPVSVKTRIGFSEIQTEEWIGFLLQHQLDALTVHGRTVKELSDYPAHWDEIGKVVQLRNQAKLDTVIIGNGDILSYQQGLEMAEQYKVDGIMIGRGVFNNPWIFNPNIDPNTLSIETKVQKLIQHIQLFQQTWGNEKNFAVMKKCFKMYLNNFPGASEIRSQLMQCNTAEECIKILVKLL
ncbi:MAG: tRNA dihydrouridine synthase [Minisyncoccia bacterium]